MQDERAALVQDTRAFMDTNRARWDEMVPIHAKSTFYNVEGFLNGRLTLDDVERACVGEPAGKTLLHLQCHFGMDTLSWARLGAKATGVDFSEPAIALARDLNAQVGLDVRFIQANIYDLPELLDEQFDVVFTSHGVLTWLPDVWAWGEVVGKMLKPGGRFVIVEGHPYTWMLEQENVTTFDIRYDYFTRDEPYTWDEDGSYAQPDAQLENRRTYEWNHPLGDVVTALVRAGLTIEEVKEYDACAWQALPFMVQRDEHWWTLPDGRPRLPFSYSIVATKDG